MAITPEEFSAVRKFVHEHSGILLNEGKEYLVENRLTVLLVQNGCENFLQLCQKLQTDAGPLRNKVIDAMTTNETLWFRDDSFFSALSDHIIPLIMEKARSQSMVRIWSAACSTGQEPYSVAMLLEERRRMLGPSAPALNRFSILATDISPSALFIASAGRYSQLAISRGMKDNFLDKYFKKTGITYELDPTVRNLVKFQPFNLKNTFTPFGSFDFIMCRNVLIYFSDELKKQIYSKLSESLARDGILAIGASESPRGYTEAFEQVMLGGAAVFKPKGSGAKLGTTTFEPTRLTGTL